MQDTTRLEVGKLRWHCDPDQLGFESSDELDAIEKIDGTRRWSEALKFGVSMRRAGYNIFAIGPQGIGKHHITRHLVEDRAKAEPIPEDWCYVYNFSDPHKPNALRLPAKRGRAFKNDVEHLIADLKEVVVATFEGEDYRSRRQMIEQEISDHQESTMSEIEKEASSQSLMLLKTPMGFAFAPVADGEVIQPQDFQKLPAEEQRAIEQKIETLQEKLQKILQQVPLWMRQVQQRVRDLNRETASFAVTGLFDGLLQDYGDLPEIPEHLGTLKADIIANVDGILQMPDKVPGDDDQQASQTPLLRRYGVNLIVDNAENQHAPVIYEDNPTYDRLLGKVEHRSEMGTLVTDFHLIRPGAIHAANQGYLLIDAQRLLSRPMAYEGLKQTLRSGTIRIESLADHYGLVSTTSLEPKPIPHNVKIVLLGERMLYYLLSAYDPEFGELFKVVADFDSEILRDQKSLGQYSRLIAGLAQKADIKPLDKTGMARLLEHSARLADDSSKLTMHAETLREILVEADYWSDAAKRKSVVAADIDKAVEKRDYRVDRIREQTQEHILNQVITIETDSKSVGQLNGLSVIGIGDFSFGRPSRITARVRLGSGDVVDIEREAKLGGPLHSKGVLILSGFLGSRFCVDYPLSLSASLVFEQSYGGVDGDSASAGELIALMSAIADLPLRQAYAITGSVDQGGRVQAIGGVNQKIEGFFDICRKRRLSGEQGVLIPASNKRHLMLRHDVVEAVEAGKFHIYAIETVDQGIELLSGLPAGSRDATGAFPAGSFNAAVADKLKSFADARRKFGAPGHQAGETQGK